MNKVTLIGRLTKAPTIIPSENGSTVARYTLAIGRPLRNGEESTDFISCVAFGNKAAFAQNFLRKGMKIAVSGRLQSTSYEKSNGETVYGMNVVVQQHEFCEPKKANASDDRYMDYLDEETSAENK